MKAGVEQMKKDSILKILKSSEFRNLAIFVFVFVTGSYLFEFNKFIDSFEEASNDKLLFWLAYIIVLLFLQILVFINAKRKLFGKK